MMRKDLGVWTSEDCALVLIDYQKETFEVIRSETDVDVVELNVRLLVKAATAFNMPTVGRWPVPARPCTAIERLAHAGAVPTTALAVHRALPGLGDSLGRPARLVR